MKLFHPGILILSVAFQIFASGGELQDPSRIFGVKEVCISDGSSVYVFSPDGKFRLEPLGLSGRTIEGTWKRDSTVLHITGKWGWVNGLAEEGDLRQMDLHIGSLRETVREHVSALTGSKHQIHECYFVIDRLEKKRE